MPAHSIRSLIRCRQAPGFILPADIATWSLGGRLCSFTRERHTGRSGFDWSRESVRRGQECGPGLYCSRSWRSSSPSITSLSISRTAIASRTLRRDAARCRAPPDRGVVDDPADLDVDLVGRLLAVRSSESLTAAAIEEHRDPAVVEVHAAQPAHAELLDHAAGDAGWPVPGRWWRRWRSRRRSAPRPACRPGRP